MVVLFGIYSIKRILKTVTITFPAKDCVFVLSDDGELLWTHWTDFCFRVSSPVTILRKESLSWNNSVKFSSQICGLQSFCSGPRSLGIQSAITLFNLKSTFRILRSTRSWCSHFISKNCNFLLTSSVPATKSPSDFGSTWIESLSHLNFLPISDLEYSLVNCLF